MEIKKGIAVSPGVAIAKSLIIDSEDYLIPRRSIEPSQRMIEIQRARNAFKAAINELTKLKTEEGKAEQQKIKDIFAVHLRFLHDRSLRKKVTDLVQAESVTAEYAVSATLREIASHFAGGGHKKASGCLIKGKLPDAEKKVLSVIKKYV